MLQFIMFVYFGSGFIFGFILIGIAIGELEKADKNIPKKVIIRLCLFWFIYVIFWLPLIFIGVGKKLAAMDD